MARSRDKTKSASAASPKRLEMPARAVKEIGLDLAALPYDEQCVVVGAMVMNPLSARTFLENQHQLKDGNAAFVAWADRMCNQLKYDKQHKPVAAKHVGKAVVERTRQDPSTKDEIKRPDIFGVFAMPAASGVLPTRRLYDVAVACLKRIGRSTVANDASRKLITPINHLVRRGLLAVSAKKHVQLPPGCEMVFDKVDWPPPKLW
jgi:hypothetical protein